jgi:hypothetical protein
VRAVGGRALGRVHGRSSQPDGADSLRSRLTQLQSNPELASRAPLAIKDAEIAVTAAETPQADKVYLMGQGISSTRLTASGKGESSPVGDNSSATGRQQNRRVEVIIENTLVSSRWARRATDGPAFNHKVLPDGAHVHEADRHWAKWSPGQKRVFGPMEHGSVAHRAKDRRSARS